MLQDSAGNGDSFYKARESNAGFRASVFANPMVRTLKIEIEDGQSLVAFAQSSMHAVTFVMLCRDASLLKHDSCGDWIHDSCLRKAEVVCSDHKGQWV